MVLHELKIKRAHLNKVYSESLGVCIIPHISSANTEDTRGESLSVTYKNIRNTHRITTDTLKDIWAKAYYLVDNFGLVCKVPGQPTSDNRMVASLTGNEPHYIVEKTKSQFVCSGICHRFSTYKICEHIIAACEDSGKLKLF